MTKVIYSDIEKTYLTVETGSSHNTQRVLVTFSDAIWTHRGHLPTSNSLVPYIIFNALPAIKGPLESREQSCTLTTRTYRCIDRNTSVLTEIPVY